MADGTTTYGDINQRTAAWAATEALKHAEPVIILNKLGQMKPLPKNKANTVKFRRPIPFSALDAPLQEGVTPTAQKMAYEDVTCVMKGWGKPIEITDVVLDQSEDPVLRDAMMLAGEQAAATIESVTWGIIRAGTNIIYANGTARTDVNTPISLNKIKAATRTLKAQKAQKITMILDASPKYGTRAVEASYVAVAHTNLEADIRDLPGFTPVSEYGSRKTLSPHEIGAVLDVRFILSPDLSEFADAGGAYGGSGTDMVSTTGVSADIYPIIVLGKEAFGAVPLKGSNALTPMVVNPKPSAADPMAQRGYVSWKAYFNAVILNELWMVRIECAATDL